MPLEDTGGLQPGDTVVARPGESRLEVGLALLGRILDGFGQPMDGGPKIRGEARYDLYASAPGPLEREHITEPLVRGVRAIDSLLPLGKVQRIGIFGGSGVGKSTLLGALARHRSADVSVIALIGERNREVRDFLEKELSPEGLKRSVWWSLHPMRRASAHPSGIRRAGGGRVFSRSRAERLAGGRLGDTVGNGATRDRIGRRRAAQPEGLHAQRLSPPAANL